MTDPLEIQKAKQIAAAVVKDSGGDLEIVMERMKNEAEKRERRAAEILREAQGFRKILEGFETVTGKNDHPPDAPRGFGVGRTLSTPERPAGVEAIRRVMREGGIWDVASLLEELTRRGWEPVNAQNQVKATEAAMRRLRTVYNEIERVSRGKYRYIQEPPGSPADGAAMAAYAQSSIGDKP